MWCDASLCVLSFLVFFSLTRLHFLFFFFSSRRRHTRYIGDWSSDVCSSDLVDQHPHAESFPDPGYLPADGAVADDAERAAAQFLSHRRLRYPARAVVHGRAGDAAGEIHHESRSEERRVGKGTKTRGGWRVWS